jgi:hypothetical protein
MFSIRLDAGDLNMHQVHSAPTYTLHTSCLSSAEH